MSFFGFGQSADIDIELDGSDTRKLVEIKQEDGRKDRYYLYYDGETVSGKVNVNLKKAGSRLEHQGIKIEFVGQIELYYDRGNHHEFTSLVKELARPGELIQNSSYDFEFNQVEKPYESYTGTNVRLRYFLRVTLVRRISDIVREMDLIVHTLSSYPDSNNSIKMEVGIEDCLHIEFEYNKSKYHLKDVIVGKIYFLLVRIKIKHMEIAIMKRETTGSGPNTFNESETIAKYEIMDGAPVRGESIPIRVFLAGYDLTPSMRDINKKFSVRYYLNLVLVDEEERRYFKQQEITLWRKGERVRRPLQEQLLAQQQAMQQLHLQHQSGKHAVNDPRLQQQVGVEPPLGAEPPSPHQSQSPMQEEVPPVPSAAATASFKSTTNSTAAATQPFLVSTTQQLQEVEEQQPSHQPSASEQQQQPSATVTTALPIDDSSSVPPLTGPITPPPLPVSQNNSTTTTPTTAAAEELLDDSSSIPPAPRDSSSPPPVDEVEPLAATDGENIAAAGVHEEVQHSQEEAATSKPSDIPPLVCSSEPPELPSPPHDPLESPEDDEFLEASAASPQKKEALPVAQ